MPCPVAALLNRPSITLILCFNAAGWTTFAASSHVLVTGVSVGGFGAAFNYDRIAQAFCGARVTLVDDSGPPMSDQYLAPCLQKRWRELWNFDSTLPADCAGCRNADGGGIVNYVDYLSKKYPTQQLGLISANMDSIISLFFGYGENNCAGLTGPFSRGDLPDRPARYGALAVPQ